MSSLIILENIRIRPIVPEDNAAIARIIRATLTEFGANHPGTVFTDPTTDDLYTLFRAPGSFYHVAVQEGELLGGAGIFPSAGLPAGTCELVKMYLVPGARSIGLGRRMIADGLDKARSMGYRHVYIETMPELQRAVEVYRRFGFRDLPGPLGNTGHFGCSVWMMLDL
ncbi:MAG: GNAT family N-acetyltransferase [Chitinophagaceae bacterium]|jgi:putative acetyltransferase|nr:GNAT family N-acetyltransferase [Chitinophagaceae bacterium]